MTFDVTRRQRCKLSPETAKLVRSIGFPHTWADVGIKQIKVGKRILFSNKHPQGHCSCISVKDYQYSFRNNRNIFTF